MAISRHGQVVSIVAGRKAQRLIELLDKVDDSSRVQQLLARASGNYRRGNERSA